MQRCVLTVCLLVAARAAGQGMPMQMGGAATSAIGNVLRHSGSGTSLEPGAATPPMLMRMTGDGWMLMLHGVAFAVEQQQTGPRGDDKFFSVNWLMPMAQRNFHSGQLTLRTMLSLEPATITRRFYPELFQQGETAYGRPIVDGQHPHNLFMEIAGMWDQRLGEKALITFYVAPVGDPALGPVAYPHRASASEDPLATLGHHLQDSTHISYSVMTLGLTAGAKQLGVRLEGSGFHGREPDENRWQMQVGAIDSWSARLSVMPDSHWTGQYSLGRLASPEAVHPDENVLRQTASIHCHYGSGTALDAGVVWGRNHTVGEARNANGYGLEATAHLGERQSVWTRMEDVDRTSELLRAHAPAIESVIGRVQAYTGGYAHSLWGGKLGGAEIGAQATGYVTPARLVTEYGGHPWGVAGFVKVRLGK